MGLPLAGTFVSSVAAPLGMTSLAASADSVGAAQAARIRNIVIRQVNNWNLTSRVIVVVGDDSVTNEIESVKVSLDPVGDAPPPSTTAMTLPFKVLKANGNKRFVNTTLKLSGPAVGSSYNVVATMLDAAGAAVGNPVVSTVAVTAPDPADAEDEVAFRSTSVQQVDASNFLLQVAVDDPAGAVGSVDVIFVDFTGPAPIPTEVTLTNPLVVRGTSIFSMETLTFEDPNAAVDALYDVVIDLKDATNKSLGYVTGSVLVDGLDAAGLADDLILQTAVALEDEAANLLIDTLDTDLRRLRAELDAAGIVLSAATQSRLNGAINRIGEWKSSPVVYDVTITPRN